MAGSSNFVHTCVMRVSIPPQRMVLKKALTANIAVEESGRRQLRMEDTISQLANDHATAGGSMHTTQAMGVASSESVCLAWTTM